MSMDLNASNASMKRKMSDISEESEGSKMLKEEFKEKEGDFKLKIA